MLAQLQLTTQQTAHIAPHAQMKGRVVPFYGIQQLAHLHLHAQFLGYFPGNRILGRLSRLNLATRKLPSPTMLVLRAFHRQHTPLGIQNKGCHYLHNSKILAHAHDSTILQPFRQTITDTAGRFSSLQRRGKSVE